MQLGTSIALRCRRLCRTRQGDGGGLWETAGERCLVREYLEVAVIVAASASVLEGSSALRVPAVLASNMPVPSANRQGI